MILKPLIEQFGAEIRLESPLDVKRKEASDKICRYLHTGDVQYLPDYYEGVQYLLYHKESQRILLYLPFTELLSAPAAFRETYMNAWWQLTTSEDASENFHFGDTFELDARPRGQLSRVVKCAHLLPWLIKSRYIQEHQLLHIFETSNNKLLLQSLKDTFSYLRSNNILNKYALLQIDAMTQMLPERQKYAPLYISDKRKQWLDEMNRAPSKLATPNAHLEGPFFPNFSEFSFKDHEDILNQIQSSNTDIVLLGGSRLKGYGTVDSDFDIWSMNKLNQSEDMAVGSPHAAHLYFNTVWAVGSDVHDVNSVVQQIIKKYDDPKTRKYSLERMESDLIQYRLLHKGYSRFTNMHSFETSAYLQMDGDCPFYEDRFRKIATMLFAKYVFIPHVR